MSVSPIPQDISVVHPAVKGDLLTPTPTDAGCATLETHEVTVTGETTPAAAQRTLALPGPKTIIAPSFMSIREALCLQLLVNQAHLAGSKEKKKKWGAFYEQTLGIGANAPHQGAVMSAFVPYANAKPWLKFEKFVLAGVTFDDAEYHNKMTDDKWRD